MKTYKNLYPQVCSYHRVVQKEGRSVCWTPKVVIEALLRPYLWRYISLKMLILVNPKMVNML